MTTPTPDNAARETPVAWLDLGRLTEKNMVYATGFKANDAQSPLYSAATVTALEARIGELESPTQQDDYLDALDALWRIQGNDGSVYKLFLAFVNRVIPLTGAGAK